MQKVVLPYQHAMGRHCGTTSISRLLHFYGREISEPMCLGLGQGIDFAYLADPQMNPSHYWLGRWADLESDCLTALGVAHATHRTEDAALAWQWVKDEIDAGRPAMIQADIRWLDYYHTKTHFGGHKIIVVGYDEQKQTALLSDNEFPEMQEVPLAGLAKARSQTAPPWILQNEWFEVHVPEHLISLDTAVPAAVATLARRLLSDRGSVLGMTAFANAVRDLPRWAEAADWQWCARFGYQIIEKRGTGGGNFRKMYAEFLREAIPHCPDVLRLELPARMEEIATRWTALAAQLKEVSEREQPGDGFDVAAELLAQVFRNEREYYEAAATCSCGLPAAVEVG